MTKNPVCRRTRSVRMPFYGRDPRVPRRGIADAQDDRTTVILGQIRDRRRRGKTVTAAGGGRKEQFCGGERERKEAR